MESRAIYTNATVAVSCCLAWLGSNAPSGASGESTYKRSRYPHFPKPEKIPPIVENIEIELTPDALGPARRQSDAADLSF